MKYKNNQLLAYAEAKISFNNLGPQLTKERKKAEHKQKQTIICPFSLQKMFWIRRIKCLKVRPLEHVSVVQELTRTCPCCFHVPSQSLQSQVQELVCFFFVYFVHKNRILRVKAEMFTDVHQI